MVSAAWIQGFILLTKLRQTKRNYIYLVETCVQQKSSLCGFTSCVRVLFETLVAQRSRNPAVNTGLSTKKVVNVSHCLRRPLRKGWPAQYWFKLSSQSSPTESRPVIWLTSGPVNSKQKSSWLETGMNVVADWVHFKQAKALQTSSGQRPVSCEGGQLSIR